MAVVAALVPIGANAQGPEPVHGGVTGRAFFAHTPGVRDLAYGVGIRERMQDGWATGGTLFWSGDIVYNPRAAVFNMTFPNGEADLLLMPVQSHEAAIDVFMAHFNAAQRARMTYVHFQEPENDLLTEAAIAEWRQDVVDSCDVVHQWGARCAIMMQAETLNPANPHRWADEAVLASFMTRRVVAAVDDVSFTFFNFANNSLVPAVRRVERFMRRHHPGVPWGAGSVGISVKIDPPASDADRAERAGHVQDLYEEFDRFGITHGSWWDFYNEPLNRDYAVDSYLLPVLQAHSQGGVARDNLRLRGTPRDGLAH
jgi:hypothetical protein